MVLEEGGEKPALLLIGADSDDQVAPFPALAERLRDRAVALGKLRHDQSLGDEIGAVASPFLRDGHGAEPELGAFLDDVPIEGLARIADRIALERDRADLFLGEFACCHLPGALLVAQREIHGIDPHSAASAGAVVRWYPAIASATRSLVSLLGSPECRQMRASPTYFCSGMSRMTPMAPKHSAASFVTW